MKIAYFDCYSGISGDMTLGAFLDAGLDIKVLERELKKLNLKGYSLKRSAVKRGEIAGTKFDCIVKTGPHTHMPLKDIIDRIDKSALGRPVKDTAKRIFFKIGEAEAKIHGVKAGRDVELSELGEIDSIVDIVGTAIAVDELGIEEVYSSVVNLGRDFADTRHGRIPIPGPASLEMLKGVPSRILNINAELVTPTGAGILKALSKGFGEMPQMKISDIGYGAGTRELSEIPNMLRVVMGQTSASYLEDNILVIETNIDDMNPQNFEYLFERLLSAGALDVYTTTIQMKKSRPAFKLTVLAGRELLEKASSIIFSETTAIGLRYYEANRHKLSREIKKVKTAYGDVRVKVSKGPDNILTVAPEYEECMRLARSNKVPLKAVYDEAKNAVKV